MKKRILLIDDDNSSLYIIRLFLEKSFDIISTPDARHAIDILSEQKFDIIGTDICMPHINGYDILKKAKEMDKDVNVIAFSASFCKKDRKKIIEKGFFNFFLKPFKKEEVLEIFKKAAQI